MVVVFIVVGVWLLLQVGPAADVLQALGGVPDLDEAHGLGGRRGEEGKERAQGLLGPGQAASEQKDPSPGDGDWPATASCPTQGGCPATAAAAAPFKFNVTRERVVYSVTQDTWLHAGKGLSQRFR